MSLRAITRERDDVSPGSGKMKIKFDSQADILLLLLSDNPPVDAVEERGGVIVSYAENGDPVSVEFLNASLRKLILPGDVSVPIQKDRISI